MKGEDAQLAAGEIVIPVGTLRRVIKQNTAAETANKGKIDVVYLDTFNRCKKTEGLSTRSLLTLQDRDFIQKLFSLRDIRNNGMRQGEVNTLIQTMCMMDFKTTEDQYYYLRKSKKLPMLKSHGKLQTAHRTTTKRSNVTTGKLLRWHGTCDETMEEMDRLNSWHPEWDNIKKSKTIDSF